MRLLCFCSFWFVALFGGGRLVCAQDASVQAPPSVVYLSGQVLSEDDRPLAGVGVCARPRVMGQLLNAVRGDKGSTGGLYRAQTDEQGRFKVPVPFAEIIYQLDLKDEAYFMAGGRDALATEDDEGVTLVASPYTKQPKTVAARLKDETGDVLANRPVRMTSTAGKVAEGVTDANGVVRITHGWNFRPDLIVQSGDWITFAPWPTEIPGDQPYTHELTLTRSASLRGRLFCGDLGEPLGGADVVVTRKLSSAKPWRVTTQQDGQFSLRGLPPGEYYIRAACTTHSDRPTRDKSYFKRILKLKPGQDVLVPADTFDMQPVATWRGRVVDSEGNPVAGAMVGCRSRYLTWYDNVEVVYSDKAGRFEITDGYFDKQRHPLVAYTPEHGLAKVALTPLLPGEIGELGDIVFAGATRVLGTVTDRAGLPIEGIGCRYRKKYDADVWVRTDEQGRYDLGWLPIARETKNGDGLMEVSFSLHRTRLQRFEKLPEASSSGSCVVNMRKLIEPKRGSTARVDARLQRTDRLDFHGQVVDDKGKPIKRARVYLLPGKVVKTAAQSREAIATFIAYRDGRERYNNQPPQGDIGFYNSKEIDLPEGKQMPRELSVTHTNEQGAWGLSCLRADSDPSLVRLGQYWSKPLVDEQTPPRPDLQWATVLVAWGERDDVQYRLSDPVQIVADRTQYEVIITP